MSKINYLLLEKFYQEESSYIAATIKYVETVLDIDISEFSIKDLPKEWIECIKSEARRNNLAKDTGEFHSFMSINEIKP